MLNQHLISNTKYATGLGILFLSAKMRYHENSFWELAKCCETFSIPTANQMAKRIAKW